MYNINNIELIDEADVPSKPYNINHKKDIAIFTFIGLAIAVVYIIGVDMLDTTIKSPENVEKEFDLPVLASIPLYETKNKSRGDK